MNKDILIKEEMDKFNIGFKHILCCGSDYCDKDCGEQLASRFKSFLESSLSRAYEEGRKDPIPTSDIGLIK
jgi:hypothetical protein